MNDHDPYVLVVDDEPDGREAVCRYLSKAGYRVESAATGREALHKVTTQMPSVIILDAMMPEMDGVRFLEVIRSYLRWQRMPVIMLTAYEKGPHLNNARALDVRQIFFKAHYDLSDLRRAIDECCGPTLRESHSPQQFASPN